MLEKMWRKGSPPILLVGNKLVEPLWRVWRFLKTQNTELPYDPAILCLHIYSVTSEVAQLCPTLCDPMDCSPPGSSVHGISQARILEWVAIPSSRGSSWCRNQTSVFCISCIAGGFLTFWATGASCTPIKWWKSRTVTTLNGGQDVKQ